MQENQKIQIVSNNSIENKNDISIQDDSNKHPSTMEKFELPKIIKDYKITSYPDNCEEFSRINKIIPLKKKLLQIYNFNYSRYNNSFHNKFIYCLVSTIKFIFNL